MAKRNTSQFDTISFLAPLLLILYLCIGFIPNLGAVDKIAPQWLSMSGLNLISILYFFYNRKSLRDIIGLNLNSKLSLTYIGFILWAIGSLAYAINPTEVLVNLSRQLNVFLMFFIMACLTYNLKNKINLLAWIVSIILAFEIYAVLDQAIDLFNSTGRIQGGQLKGVTANRNVTAFSIAIKIPFVLYLIHVIKKTWKKLALGLIITLGLVSLSMIQSRASFVAVGLIVLAYTVLQSVLYYKDNKKKKHLFTIAYLLVPLFLAILVNQTFLSSKGADAISRAATISVSTSDNSINQRLRYYQDVLTHFSSNPFFGVGLGNWKLKSIDYDKNDINGYVVPYHAHSDFIQLGAELGIIGFLLYLGVFIWAVYYVYRLLRYSELALDEKVFLFLIITALGVYSIDANLNFPIARPQVLVIWTLIMGLITGFYQKEQNKTLKLKPSAKLSSVFLVLALLLNLPSIQINNTIYKSLKGQMFLLQDFNSNNYNVPLNQVDNFVPDMPNITVTTIPINSVKARYYVNAKKYDKALALLDKGTNANPYLYYSEILKSQIFQEQGKLDSAKVYARKAFFGLPNNDLHASRYINLINITRDKKALEEAFEFLTYKNKLVNWKNYLIIANSIKSTKDSILIERAKKAVEIFPNNGEIKNLYIQIAIVPDKLNESISYSKTGLDYFNKGDYQNAAIEFEKALEANPLDYAHFENAATANYMIGNLEKAEEQIDVVINDLNPLNGKCEYIKALIYIKMGDPIGACPFLATARDSGFSQAAVTFDQYCK
ncbi:O-antigen ligase family protein [Flavobacteriaceae bacterium]|nr:O-antigen ligase family protein [Flavobacteriaceae bacterium]